MKTTLNNSDVKSVRLNVNAIDRYGLKYFVIYEVRGVTFEGHTITIDRYLHEKDAEKQVAFANRYCKRLYSCIFIREHWVWC